VEAKHFRCRGLAADLAQEIQRLPMLPLEVDIAGSLEELVDFNIEAMSKSAAKTIYDGDSPCTEQIAVLRALIALRLASVSDENRDPAGRRLLNEGEQVDVDMQAASKRKRIPAEVVFAPDWVSTLTTYQVRAIDSNGDLLFAVWDGRTVSKKTGRPELFPI